MSTITTTDTTSLAGALSELAGKYRELVIRTAKGGKVSSDELSRVLFGSGRNPTQFEGDVKRVAQRIAAAEKLDLAERKQGELTKLRRASEAANARHEKLIKDCEAELQKSAADQFEALRAFRELSQSLDTTSARSLLTKTADPSFHERLRDINARRNAAEAMVHAVAKIPRCVRLPNGVNDFETYERLDEQAKEMGKRFNPTKLRADADIVKRFLIRRQQIADAEADAGRAREELKQLRREEESVVAEMQKPKNAKIDGAPLDPHQIG